MRNLTPLAPYIDGHFIGADERDGEDVVNAASNVVLGRLPHATTQDVNSAMKAAARAFETWRWSSPLERTGVLRRVTSLIHQGATETFDAYVYHKVHFRICHSIGSGKAI